MVVALYCGDALPEAVTYRCSEFKLLFKTDYTETFSGFKLQYKTQKVKLQGMSLGSRKRIFMRSTIEEKYWSELLPISIENTCFCTTHKYMWCCISYKIALLLHCDCSTVLKRL